MVGKWANSANRPKSRNFSCRAAKLRVHPAVNGSEPNHARTCVAPELSVAPEVSVAPKLTIAPELSVAPEVTSFLTVIDSVLVPLASTTSAR